MPSEYEPSSKRKVFNNNLPSHHNYDARSPIMTEKSFSSIGDSLIDATDPNVDMHADAVGLNQDDTTVDFKFR